MTSPEEPAAAHEGEAEEEALFHAAEAAIKADPPPAAPTVWGGALKFILWVGFCCLFIPGEARWMAVALLAPAMLLSELGRFVAMRSFGHPGRLLFDPFPDGPAPYPPMPVWKQATVLLMGPLPGLFLALAIQAAFRPDIGVWLGAAVLWLVILNAMNLLPFVPFHGGRLLDLLFFARSPWLAAGFHALCAAVLVWVSWMLGTWVYAVLGGLVLLGVPVRYRKAEAERLLAEAAAGMPDRLDDASEGQRRELFATAVRVGASGVTPDALAADMRKLHSRLTAPRPPALIWAALFLLYLAGWVAGASAVSLLFTGSFAAASTRREAADLAAITQVCIRKVAAGEADPRLLPELRERWMAADAAARRAAREALVGKAGPIPDPVRAIIEEAAP